MALGRSYYVLLSDIRLTQPPEVLTSAAFKHQHSVHQWPQEDGGLRTQEGVLLVREFFRAVLPAPTITCQIVGMHSYPLRASTVKRSRDVKAMMAAASISAAAFVSIYKKKDTCLIKR